MTGADNPAGGSDEAATSTAAPTAAPSPWMEQACAVCCLALGLAVIVGGRSIELRNETGGIDPRFWPTVVGGGIVLAAIWMTFNAFTSRRAERDVEPATRSGWGQLVATVVIAAVVLAIWYAGVPFLWLAPVFLIGLNLVFGIRNMRSLVLFPAVMTGFLYLVFHLLLTVPL